jgi:hypothetical protein
MPVPAASLPDFRVSGGGTVYLVRPTTDEARDHLAENVQDDAQWFGGALAVEHRYIAPLIDGLTSAGFSVGGGW